MTNSPVHSSPIDAEVQTQSFVREEVIKDLAVAFRSRMASNAIRREVLSGKAKFGIEGGGKEMPQVVMAQYVEPGDYYSGYYRDQTFGLRRELARIEDIFAALYGDANNDPFSGGRQMNNHFATPFVNEKGEWLDLKNRINLASGLAPLGGNITHALGLALASKKYRAFPEQTNADQISVNGNELSICTLGDATTSEGVFFEAVNAAGVMKIPIVFVIYDDGHGISVPTEYQTTKGSISEVLEGFRINSNGEGLHIHAVKAWDYENLHAVFADCFDTVRRTHQPAIVHVQECTQPNGHSTSGSHERYKSKERLEWEHEADAIPALEQWIIQREFATKEEIEAWKKEWKKEVRQCIKNAWQAHSAPSRTALQEVMSLYHKIRAQRGDSDELLRIIEALNNAYHPVLADIMRNVEDMLMLVMGEPIPAAQDLLDWYEEAKQTLEDRYQPNLVAEGADAAIQVPHIPAEYGHESQMVSGFELLNKNFDALFAKYDNLYAFGEDLGKIGGVNQSMAGLQAKYGEERIFDTGIREWTIAAQAIGMAMRGLRPIAEIQYLDYIHYAVSPLADDLATLRYRTDGMQISPAIIRTRGHRLEGIWHSGSPIAMLLHSMRGIYILSPRNMTQAAGMYNTLLQANDPAIMIECLNGYRQKEALPDNVGEFTVPLGVPEILRAGEDITIVTYGACVRIAEKACEALARKGISVELIDAQTLLPFDRPGMILDSLKKTNRIIFLDEDVPGGASAFMMQEVIEKQN
ncbi:MAG: thiamine pyrophosphate-dependent enzyme, partial [Bacteroidota bacterium]